MSDRVGEGTVVQVHISQNKRGEEVRKLGRSDKDHNISSSSKLSPKWNDPLLGTQTQVVKFEHFNARLEIFFVTSLN